MDDAEIRRIRTSNYVVHDGTIYHLYTVKMKFDGKEMEFDSVEHAKAWLEDREPRFQAFVTP
jgi:hypothetical protein